MPYLRYFLDPFGCVKNQVDAENMTAHLNQAGWEAAPEAENADLIIVNSCGFIKSAKQESINAVIAWRKLYPNKKILLSGCLAQRYAKELPGILSEADGFFGTENINQITEIASSLVNIKPPAACSLPTGERPLLSPPGSAYVKISEGCGNFCSYCAIPLIRGRLKSRTIPDILEEIKTLLKRGIKEFCIIAQDTGSFGTDTIGTAADDAALIAAQASRLPELLSAISHFKGHFWVRLLYIHPDHFPLSILDIMEKDSRILPYFDVPFQHASQEILSAMNRRGSQEKYLELLDIIRSRFAHAVIRSTFLLGFPGETEKDFELLLNFQEKAKLDWLGCFTYSREEGTAAYKMKNQVSKKTAVKRKKIIEERQLPITEKNMERFTGKTFDVLVEEQIESNDDESGESIWLGRLYCHALEIDAAAVIVCDNEDKAVKPGNFVLCKVTARRGIDLEVKLL